MITENCTYSVPLNGQDTTPVSGEFFQFSESSCSSVGTSTVSVDLTPLLFAYGFGVAMASMIFIIWLFRKS